MPNLYEQSLFQRILQNIDQIELEGNEYTTIKNTHKHSKPNQYILHDGFFYISDKANSLTPSDKSIIIREKIHKQKTVSTVTSKRLSELIINESKDESAKRKESKLAETTPQLANKTSSTTKEPIKKFDPPLNQIKIEEINIDSPKNNKKIPIKSKKPDNKDSKIKKLMSKIFC